MRDIFTFIASFVHRQTRTPGFFAVRRSLLRVFVVAQVWRKPVGVVFGVLVLVGIFSGVAGHVSAAAPVDNALSIVDYFNPLFYIMRGVNWLLEIGVGLAGKMATLLVSILLKIAVYNDFLSSSAVANGWVVTRDIANMFFIVILLVIAFGTILGDDKYNTKMLSKLLIMAVVINFSRTIIGIMIDASQIIMLTFVNGFSAAGAGNFINAFGVNKILTYKQALGSEVNVTGLANIAGALIMGLILMLVACSVLLTIVGTLLFRIAYLWLLIVLAPLAWLMATIPAGKKYYDQWWDQFRDQLVVGPAMAFFLWLSLTAVGSGLAWNQVVAKDANLADVDLGMTQLLTSENILSFIITIVLLLASVKMANQLAGSAAGYGTFMKQWASGIARGRKIAVGAAKGTVTIADRFQAANFSGMHFSKIPERLKAGFTARNKLMDAQAKARGLKYATALQKYPLTNLVAGRALAPILNPEGFAKTVLTKGIFSRFRKDVIGENFDRKWLRDGAAKTRKKAKFIREGIKSANDIRDFSQADRDTAAERFKKSGNAVRTMREQNTAMATWTNPAATPVQMLQAAKTLKAVDESMTLGQFNNMSARDRAAMDRTAIATYNDNQANRAQVLSERRSARQEFNQKNAAHTALQADYTTAHVDRENRLAEANRLDQKAGQREAWYVKGETPNQREMERHQLTMEGEINKEVDLSRSSDELIGELQRYLAKGNTEFVNFLSKEVAKRGDSTRLFESFGIHEKGLAGLKRYEKEVLKDKAHIQEGIRAKTIMRMAEHEFKANNYQYGKLFVADPITNTVRENDPEENVRFIAKSMKGKPLLTVLNDVQPDSVEYIDDSGARKMATVALSVVDKINENPNNLDKIEGRYSPDIIRRLASFDHDLEQLVLQGHITQATVDKIRDIASKIPPKNPEDRVKGMYDYFNP